MSLLSPPLEAFKTVAECQTVHGAAKILGLTQTGVTQRLRAPESMLSTTLFTRSRRGMVLTQEGQALLRYCRGATDLEGEALAMIQGAGKRSEVRVCITGPSSIMRSRIIPQCQPTLHEFPELVLTFDLKDSDEWVGALKNGTAHLGVIPPHLVVREMDSKMLKAEKYVLVGPKKWSKRSTKEVVSQERIIDFDYKDNMTFDYLEKFKLRELVKKERHFLNNTESLVELFKEGLGYGVLTLEFAKSSLEKGDLILLNSGHTFEFPQALAWYPRPEMPAYFSSLVKKIK